MRLSLAVGFTVFTTFAVSAHGSGQPLTNFTLARGQVGALRIGITTDEVIELFGKARVKNVDLYLEGLGARKARESPSWCWKSLFRALGPGSFSRALLGSPSASSASVVPVRLAAIYWVFCTLRSSQGSLATVGGSGTSKYTTRKWRNWQTHQLEGLAVAIS